MRAIDLAAKKYKTFKKEDIILLSCPDLVEGIDLSKPDWCDEVQVDVRIPHKGYNCHMCWHREVEDGSVQKIKMPLIYRS